MDFGALPPEVNSGRMYTGPGSGTMLAAAAEWERLAAELDSSASAYSSAISSLTDESWVGPVSQTMAAAATPYVVWIGATASQCEQAAGQAAAAATAYESAFAMTVPPPVIAANRSQLATLMATNIFGQNTPAIAATEADYGEMWAQDAAAMYAYAAGSANATELTPFASPPQTSNGPAGMQAQMAAVTQALQSFAAPGSSGGALTTLATGDGATAATSVAGAPLSALAGLTGVSGKSALKGAGESVGAVQSAVAGLSALSGGQLGLIEDTTGLAMDTVGLAGLDGGGLGLDFAGVGLDFLGADELTESSGLGALGAVAPEAQASVGEAASLGTLSVPQSWGEALSAAPVTPVGSLVSAGEHAGGTSTVAAGGTNLPRLPLSGMIGRGESAVTRIGVRANVIPHSPLGG
ncbi:PPE family protein [Mycobacterium asiaticum]|uniref:PPE family domain-containing protein n=1 Tax=Mycobacterium asiaticum TaxID=1790 RepID=A0A1A3CUX6_MYCAS|nr:PPE family protein [Mycobacterium asiaticum]OBI90614.1 hypothetical protein A9X01_11460 [Mycobacterium asiaticum]